MVDGDVAAAAAGDNGHAAEVEVLFMVPVRDFMSTVVTDSASYARRVRRR